MMLIPLAVHAADEITASVVLKIVDGFIDQQRAVNAQWDVSATRPNISAGTHVIPTNGTPVLITVGDIATNGWSFFRNLSAYNTLSLGASPDAGTNVYEFARMPPGTYGIIPLGTSAVYCVRSGTLVTNEPESILEKMIIER